MTVDLVIPTRQALPRRVSPARIDIGDLVRLDGVPLPVVITNGDVEDDHHVLRWVSAARTKNGKPVLEGQGPHDAGEWILQLALGETVRADQIEDGDMLLFTDRATEYGIVSGRPREIRPGVLDIWWTAGWLPSGTPAVFGSVQRDPVADSPARPTGVGAMTAPALADVIYAYGKAIDEGLVSRSEAIEHLTQNYRLTALGAVDVLSTWRTIHDRYRGTSR